MKTKMKRSLSLFLAVILCLSSFMGIGVTAFAAEKREVYLIDLPRGKEPNKSGWGHPALELMNGWSTFDTDYVTVKALGDYEGNSCYCIEPGVPLYTGDSLSKEAENFWDNYPTKYNKSIVPDDIKIFIGRIMQYGYTGKNSVDWISTNSSGADDCANHLATQLLIWETVIGERDENFNKINAHDYGKKNIKEIIQGNHPLKSKIFAHYDEIETAVKNHTKTPSFTAKSKAKAKTIELKWNGKNYSADLTDSNKVLANYDFSASGLTFKKSGNVLTVIADKAPKDEVLVTADKKNGSRKGVITWTDEKIGPQTGQLQDIVTYGADVSDPVKAYFNIKVSTGNCEILKTSEDGKVDNIKFNFKGNGIDKDVVTDSKGRIFIDNIPAGVYTVTEYPIDRYVTPKSQTVTIIGGQTSTVHFSNILKKFRVKVVKSDIEKGKAQGDAKLSGAKYGLFKGEELIDTYTTDSNASFTTDYYVCDTDWTIREIESSEGYLVNDEIYKVGAEPKQYTVELSNINLDVVEQVKKGKIAIIKHTDGGSTQIETPEKDAEFQIYLKSAGSFVNAGKDEKDTIVCDEDGFASTKLLPYGVYTVHQTKGWDGREKIKDFDVYINSDGKTYKFLINNANFESYIKVVKLDKETGKQIAYEGAGFEIYDADGHRVNMQFTYPEVTIIHTFYTNSEGYLITPEKLPYGDYTLKEVQAPYGYVLDSTPIPFTVTQENSSTDTGVTIVKVKARDIAQKGIIEITKEGEIFSSVGMLGGGYIDENGNEVTFPITYSPIYETRNPANAVFQIYAAEDVVTLDGTVRAVKGELVDEITTADNGIAKSKQLYLGKYTVIEKTAPDTFVNANEQYDVELTYAGQDVKVTSTALSVFNERQKVSVSLLKELSQDERFKLGMNDEILSVQFGIYANEDIKAADGSVIPADSLITYGNCDENGKLVFNCDLPIGFKWYAKEIATDNHYILSDTKHEFDTYYKGQETEVININLNNGEPIINEFIYGTIKGLKIDREIEKTIEGALFGLFKADETEFTEDNAILTALTDKDGIFTFKNIPYGNWIVKELQPAENYLPSDDIHHITVSENEQIIEITAVNDRIPELKTTATVDGEKEATAKGEITIEDVVEYTHLIPGKEYKIIGIIMDKSTGKAFEINGKPVTSEVTFTPEKSNGTVTVSFTFDASAIKETSDLVVFETLYRDNVEIAVHADIDDEGQTVKINVPVPEKPSTPKTGDDRNYSFWIGLGFIAIGGAISAVILKIKAKKDEGED